ncbi:MFS transporter [Catenulispora yoronensis]
MELVRATRRAEQLLVPAAFVTALGNNVQLIAGALLMIRSDRTMLAVGLLFVAVAAPQAVLSPIFGRLADRYDRRRLWIGCDLASAVLALALPVWLASGGAKGPGIYAANFALAVVAALFFPVSNALIKERVRPSQVRRFNANYEMATQAGMLLSATVGGLLVQRLGAVPLLFFNAGTFAVSAALVAGVGRRSAVTGAETSVAAGATPAIIPTTASTTASTTAPTAALTAGQPASSRVPLGRLIVLYAQGSVVVTVFNALLPKLVLGEWERGAALFGIVDAIGSLGFLAATAFYKAAGRRFNDLPIAVFGFLACNVALVLQPLFGPVGLGLGVALGAFTYGTARIASRSLVMTSVDEAHAGRAFGLANGAGLAATVVAMLGIAELVDRSDSRWGFAALAGLSAVAAVAAGVLLRGPLSHSRDGVRHSDDREQHHGAIGAGIRSRMGNHERRRRAAGGVLPVPAPAPDSCGVPDAGVAG